MSNVRFLEGLELALANLEDEVYSATWEVDNLERSGSISTDSHQLRQEMALRAQILLYNSWQSQEEKDQLPTTHPVKVAIATEAELDD